MESPEEQVFKAVRERLVEARGVDLSGYSRSFVMRAIRKRMGRSGTKDYTAYTSLLHRSEDETNELVAALSINVTEFFRDKGAFEAFSAKVIRHLLAAKMSSPGSILRIWSAGCASGQEPYTLAICVEEEVRRIGECDVLATILGTDLSTDALSKARAGRYPAEQLKNMPERFRKEYFTENEGVYQVSEVLRRRVRFVRESLLDPPGSRFFDAVVCRNVLIYFSRPTHDVVVMNLHQALRPEGFLMLGRTETLMGAPRSCFENIDPENRIFRKIK